MDYSLYYYSDREQRWMLVISASTGSNPDVAQRIRETVDGRAKEWIEAGYRVRVGGIERTDAQSLIDEGVPMLLAA